MTTTSAQQTVFEELVIATKILLHEGILDTFGHISARDPEDPNAFFLAQKLAPSHITTGDIQRFNLEGETEDNRPSYLERYIHSEIYKARPDVNCVLHSHSPAVGAAGPERRHRDHCCAGSPSQHLSASH